MLKTLIAIADLPAEPFKPGKLLAGRTVNQTTRSITETTDLIDDSGRIKKRVVMLAALAALLFAACN